MKFKVDNHIIKIKRNKLNEFWNPSGIFQNQTLILIKNKWYNCHIECCELNDEYFIKVQSPSIIDKETCQIKKILTHGTFLESKISYVKYRLIKFLIGNDKINHTIYAFKRSLYNLYSDRSVKFSFILIMIIFFVDFNFKTQIMLFLIENVIIQILSFFSLCYFVLNFFNKNEKETKENFDKKYELKKENDRINEQIEKNACL